MHNYSNGNPHCRNEYTYVHGYGFTPPPPEISEKRMIRHYSNAIAIAALAVFFIPIIVSPIIYGITGMINMWILQATDFQASFTYEANEIANILNWLIAIFVPYVIYCVAIKMPFKAAMPMKKPNAKVLIPAVLVGMGVSVVGTYFTVGISFFTSIFGVSSSPLATEIPERFFGYLLLILSSVVLPAFFEEFVYRGIVMQSLRRFGDGFALLCSSIIFAIMHTNLEQSAFAFIMGLVIGYFTLRTGSLWTGIAIHFANNFLAVVLTVISTYAVTNNTLLIMYILDAVFIAFAVLAVMYLDKNDDTIFCIKESNTASLETHKMSYFFGSIGMVFLLVMVALTVLYNTVPY